MSRLQPYGYSIRPLDQGELEFRVAREKLRTGEEDDFDRFERKRKDFIDSRPDVILTEHLVFIDKRPSDSNNFEVSKIEHRTILNRQPIIGGMRQEFGVAMAVEPRPAVSQYENAEFNREQIKVQRKVI